MSKELLAGESTKMCCFPPNAKKTAELRPPSLSATGLNVLEPASEAAVFGAAAMLCRREQRPASERAPQERHRGQPRDHTVTTRGGRGDDNCDNAAGCSRLGSGWRVTGAQQVVGAGGRASSQETQHPRDPS